MIWTIAVVKLPSQSRNYWIGPVTMGGPANDGKLRPGNIQGFEILQWRSLLIPRRVRLSYFAGLDHKTRLVP
jgi:hypothetical protein